MQDDKVGGLVNYRLLDFSCPYANAHRQEMCSNMGRWLAMVLVIIGASSYGLLSSFIKIAYDQGFTDGQITPAQMTMGTLFVWVLILFQKKSWVNPFKGPWIKLGLIGIFGLALTTVFFNIA